MAAVVPWISKTHKADGKSVDIDHPEAACAVTRWLSDQNYLRDSDLRHARLLANDTGESLNVLLVKLGLVSEAHFAEALTRIFGLPLLSKTDYPDTAITEVSLSVRFLRQFHVLPVAIDKRSIALALGDPCDRYTRKAVHLASGKKIVAMAGMFSDIAQALDRLYSDGQSRMGKIAAAMDTDDCMEDDVEHLRDLASETPIIKIVNLILERAVKENASDIHIEPFPDRLNVRYRIDGMLRKVEAPPTHSTAAVTSRIKLMAQLNIAERRLPQDGRMKIRFQGKEIDARLSTAPTLYGESIVIRLLEGSNVALDYAALGFADHLRERYLKCLRQPHGIILVTGPTGSGKTTTLYTTLTTLNSPERKIITVEDPIEYHIDGINQIPVKPKIGFHFANALRSIVRQDPDVIMVGEMRDQETARIAIQAALTGHLVLSTLHTNDAVTGLTRLLDMGIENYLLASTVNAIIAQRLVRKLCPHCRQAYRPSMKILRESGLPEGSGSRSIRFFRAAGCAQCGNSGYKGRTVVIELLVLSEKIRALLNSQATSDAIRKQAIEEGMRPMRGDGLAKAQTGLTSLEEVLAVTEEPG